MIHSIDFDDTHMGSISHFSASLVPTIFALAERLRADGPALLEAFVVGFEVGGKVGRQMMPSHYRYWHPTATFGSLAAAAAAAKLLHLNDIQTEQALGLAADQAAGLRYCIDKGDYSKSLHPGFAAMRGVMLSLLVQRGANGPQGILEYPTGFCRAFSEGPRIDRITEALGQPYEIRSNSLKAFPTILISHTPIQAVLNIIKAHAIDYTQIERIHLTIARTAKGQGQNYDPETPLAARLSIPFSVAVAAIDKEISISQFKAERLKDPKTRDLMKRIEIQEDASLNERYPETLACTVRVETKAKGTLVDEVIYPKGNARNPMTRDDVTNKFRTLCAVSITEERCEGILQRLFCLEQADSIGTLCDLLRG
jgi:2-methylcitrate dehydratase PrpD